MEGMSERAYAGHAGLSRGAIQKAKTSGRLVLHADGSIDAAASDARRAAATDPSKSRPARKTDAPKQRLKSVPAGLDSQERAPAAEWARAGFIGGKKSWRGLHLRLIGAFSR